MSHSNPLFDACSCVVEFPDGMKKEHTANVISENLCAQCNPDGQQFLLLSSIIDHKKDDAAIQKVDQGFDLKGQKQLKKTTRG